MAMTLKDYAAQIQDPLRQGIVETLWGESKIIKILNFIQWKGLTYPYTKRAKRPGVGTRSLNSDYAVAPGNYAPDVETLAILGGEVRTDNVMIAMKPNARQNEISAKTEAAALMFDRLFIQGDPSQTGHANEFYGLKARSTAGQTKYGGTNGGVPTAALFSAALDTVKGPNSSKVILCNRTTRRDLSADVKSSAGGKGVFDVGLQLESYDNAKIIEVEKDENDSEIIPYTETRGSSSVTASAYIARLGGSADEKDIQGIMGMDITAKAVGDFGTFFKDIIEAVMGIGMFGPYCLARVGGLTAAS